MDPLPAETIDILAPEPTAHFSGPRPAQKITAEEVEAVRQAELLRRKRVAEEVAVGESRDA
jgi:hypothetical protein